MHVVSLFTALLGSMVALSAAAPSQPNLDFQADLTTDLSQFEMTHPIEKRQTGCPRYELISARGTGESQSSPRGNSGFVRGLLAAVPGGRNYEVVYGATSNFATGPREGAADLTSRVSSTLRTCPQTKFVFIGYSQGAMVVVTAENQGTIPSNAVAAVVLYGSPYWQAGRPENEGSATSGRGVAAFGGNQTPASYVPKTQDICIARDNICTGSGSITAHLSYPGSSYETAAIQFAASRLNALLAGTGGTGTSPTNPAPTCTC